MLRASADTIRRLEPRARLLAEIAAAIERCYRSGGKVILFGNGGSAADAQHIAAEFQGRFYLKRPSLAA
ncbi:MAG: SIS domain-containing protein, partial [candidate division WOR-3 bacterium]